MLRDGGARLHRTHRKMVTARESYPRIDQQKRPYRGPGPPPPPRRSSSPGPPPPPRRSSPPTLTNALFCVDTILSFGITQTSFCPVTMIVALEKRLIPLADMVDWPTSPLSTTEMSGLPKVTS